MMRCEALCDGTGQVGLLAAPWPPLLARGGALKSAVLAKALFPESWTSRLSLCSVRAEDRGCRLWQPASRMACDDPHMLGSPPDGVPSHTLPRLVCGRQDMWKCWYLTPSWGRKGWGCCLVLSRVHTLLFLYISPSGFGGAACVPWGRRDVP